MLSCLLSPRCLHRFGVLGLCVALLLPVAPAQAQWSNNRLPNLGDGAEVPLGVERRLGESIAREIYRDPDYLDDPVLGDYLQSIWQTLLASARQRSELTPELEQQFAWEVALIRDRSINAFALPGGYLGVHLGLISAVSSADELASVLAHELSHVTQRHIARMISQQGKQGPMVMGAMILGMLAASRTTSASSMSAANAAIMGGQAVAVQSQLNFSRDMEREADRVGYGVMTGAGFEPQGFVTMFEKLQQASRLNDNGAFPYLRSHPHDHRAHCRCASASTVIAGPCGCRHDTDPRHDVCTRASVGQAWRGCVAKLGGTGKRYRFCRIDSGETGGCALWRHDG